ncbi:MAG: glycosyltransferase family 39 protein [Armatimonadota bacterium]
MLQSKSKIDIIESLPILFVIIVAIVFRFYGLKWGLDPELHLFSYHPDEFLILGSAYMAVYTAKSLNPGFYNYPSLYIYLCAIAIAVALFYFPFKSDVGYEVYIITTFRFVTALMGVGAVRLTYWAGCKFWNKQAGCMSAFILAILPLHVQHSHFATVDVPCTLFTAACLGGAALILNRGKHSDYIIAGLFAGLAAGTKYNAGSVYIAVILAHLLRENNPFIAKIRDSKIWISLAVLIVAFIISTPGSVLYFSSFKTGILYELAHSKEGHGLVFAGTGSGLIYHLKSSLFYGLGLGVLITLIAGVFWAKFRNNKQAYVVLIFLLIYFMLLSFSEVRFARYMLPIFPAAALIVGWFITDCLAYIRDNCSKKIVIIYGAVISILVLSTLIFSTALISSLGNKDPRDIASVWIKENIQKNASIGIMEPPWFHLPPLSKDFGMGVLSQRIESANQTPYNIVIFSDYPNGEWYISNQPEWIILSDFDYFDADRISKRKSKLSKTQQEELNRVNASLDIVREKYELKKEFAGNLNIFGIKLMNTENLPHDMKYTNPTIKIYRIKK